MKLSLSARWNKVELFLIFFSSTSQLQPSLLFFLDLCNAQKMTKQQKHPNTKVVKIFTLLRTVNQKKGRKSERLIKKKVQNNTTNEKKSATLLASSALTILTQSQLLVFSQNSARCGYSGGSGVCCVFTIVRRTSQV